MADWPSRMPWDGASQSPFGANGRTKEVEIIGSNGLSTTMSETPALLAQLFGAVFNTRSRTLDFHKPRPPAPQVFIETLRDAIELARTSRMKQVPTLVDEDCFIFTTPRASSPPRMQSVGADAELAAIDLRLPVDWRVRRDDKGRIYYIDDSTRTTTWQSPLVAGEGDNCQT